MMRKVFLDLGVDECGASANGKAMDGWLKRLVNLSLGPKCDKNFEA
jgi:hypothetical protein